VFSTATRIKAASGCSARKTSWMTTDFPQIEQTRLRCAFAYPIADFNEEGLKLDPPIFQD
jgi:hypothetical protein